MPSGTSSPTVLGTVEDAASSAVAAGAPSVPARDLSKVPPQLRPHVFGPHNNANPQGRPLGASAKVILGRKETALTQTAVALALNGTAATKEQAAQLRQFIDKLVPDATAHLTAVQINFGLLPGGLTGEELAADRGRGGTP